MRKFIIYVLLGLSCCLLPASRRAPYEGQWGGEVLIVNVVFSFENGQFEERTYASNGVQVGGMKGRYVELNGTIMVDQVEQYRFDNASLSGAWEPHEHVFMYAWEVRDSRLRLVSSDETDWEFALARR